ncbi:hypothetical protein ACWGH7_24695 [Streptomyces cyaneofuscatus]|uniref:hypothetical protein n=1 Tax=Streptomyces TaxID=1883 RepID=UPI0004C8CE72|nr:MULTISPECIES: hypothetical protein [Streptomyces]RDV53780.1 hypothetical protein DDV98_02485 [Streptomyces sp. IB2014 011-12]CAD5953417.1 conserved membrane protein of unknown function [Streptomyces sp. KY70]CAD5983006.1 conserved membrane protein of unknown function [Streptomyces sp. KY75]
MNRSSSSPFSSPSGRPSLMGVTCAAIVGSVLVLVAAVLFALLPGSLSEARDFRAARPCAEIGGSAVENGDCLSAWPATVVSTETGRKKKAVTYWITLDPGTEEQPFRIRMRGDGPVWKKLAPGNQVTVSSWRDVVWAVGLGELRQDTTTKPGYAPTVQLAVGLALLIVGAVFLRGSGWLHRRRAIGAPPARTSQILVPMAATFVAVAVAVTAAVATDRLWLVLLLTAAGCVMAWTASVLLVRRLAGVRTA